MLVFIQFQRIGDYDTLKLFLFGFNKFEYVWQLERKVDPKVVDLLILNYNLFTLSIKGVPFRLK